EIGNQQIKWARMGSNRRPLVCKSEPDGPPRFTRWHSALEWPGQRLARVDPVHALSGCVSRSWHTLGTTGGLVVRRWVASAWRICLFAARSHDPLFDQA